MRIRHVALLPVVLAALIATAQAQVITVGPNINVTRQNLSQSETGIAISRTNPNLMTISSNAPGSTNMINKYSTDGGLTWANSALQVAGGYDSGMAADSFGNIYLSYQVSQQTRVARSTDGGATYTVFNIAGGGADHPEMGIGPGTTPGTNRIVIRDSVGGQSRIISADSTGFGATTAFTTQTNQLAGNFGASGVGPGGRSVFTTMNPAGGIGPTTMAIRYDADGSGIGGYVTQSSVVTQVGGFRPLPAQPSRTVDAQVSFQYDSTGGANNGALYMQYTQAANTSTNNTDIVFRRSNDNGATFTNELKLNDDTGTNSQFFGRLAVDQATGWLAAVWYDARNSPGNNMVELWGTVSFNGGVNWVPNFKISAGMSDGRSTNTGDPNEFGDYISLDFYNGMLVTAWADSSNSTGDNPNGTAGLDIYFSKIMVAVPEPATYGLMALGLLGIVLRTRRRNN